MRDFLIWWRARTSQLLVLCSFALLLAWQNIELRRGDRYFRTIVTEIRETFRQQETIREVQFNRLLQTMEHRFAELDGAIAAIRDKSASATVRDRAAGPKRISMRRPEDPTRR